jgi:hypothetical protein
VKHLRTRYLFAGDVLDTYDTIKKPRIEWRETPFESGAFILTTAKRNPHRTREKQPMISIRKGWQRKISIIRLRLDLSFSPKIGRNVRKLVLRFISYNQISLIFVNIFSSGQYLAAANVFHFFIYTP